MNQPADQPANGHVSRFDLDALRLGALPADRAESVRVHVGACARCARARDELARSVVEFEARFDPAVLAEQTLAAAAKVGAGAANAGTRGAGVAWWRAPGFARLGWRIGLAVPAAALAVMLALRLSPPEDGVRTKGARSAIEVFVAGAGSSLEPIEGRRVSPGSTLRVRWDPGTRRYARFLWESTPGKLDALYPAPDGPALEVEAGGARWLEHDVNLDRDPQTEHLHAVYCDGAIDAGEAARAIARGSDEHCDVHRATIAKATPP